MKRLRAIWKIIIADEYAVFTYKYATQHPEIIYGDWFTWCISRYTQNFMGQILSKVKEIITYSQDDYNIKDELENDDFV